MDSMPDNPARFLGTQGNDFMYVTLDEIKLRTEITVTFRLMNGQRNQ